MVRLALVAVPLVVAEAFLARWAWRVIVEARRLKAEVRAMRRERA